MSLPTRVNAGNAGGQARPGPAPSTARSPVLPGLALTGVGVGAALALHALAPALGVLTWAVLLGALAANLGLLPAATRPGLRVATRGLLRVGVVLLGFSLPLAAIVALGPSTIALVVATLVSTLLATFWLGTRMRLRRPRALLIATGFSICGASAIAAMEETADGDEEDVTVAIAMVTVCGTAAMIALPLLQAPLGLGDTAYGVWAGASVHEVGQVVAAASPAGAAAVAVATVVKLTRVLLLAPVVATTSALRRRRAAVPRTSGPAPSSSPPLVPLFVIGFLVCVGVRSLGLLPAPGLDLISHLQTVTLGSALFGMGTGVHLKSLLRGGGTALLLAIVSTVVVAAVSLTGVLVLR